MSNVRRMAWIEWARALGALGVVLLHVFVSTLLTTDAGTMRAAVYAALGIVLGRWAVPAFFMVTGCLLLDPEKEVGWSRACRYALRMVSVLITFGFAFALMEEGWICIKQGEALAPSIVWRAMLDVASASSWDHLWYVYALIFVYLAVPAVRALAARLGDRGFAVFSLALFACILAVPTLLRMLTVMRGGEVQLPQQGGMALLSNVAVGITCLCLGGCLRMWRFGPLIIAGGVLSLAIMLVTVLSGFANDAGDLGFMFLQGSCFACLYALFVLMGLRQRFGDAEMDSHSIVGRLAQDSFGIYVLHPVFVHMALIACDPATIPPVVFEVVFFCVVLGASIATTHLIRRIPWLGGLL